MVSLTLESESRTHTRYQPKDDRYWRECTHTLQPFLRTTSLDGEYRLRPFRKTQWRADPDIPFKVTGINEPKHAIEVTIRSPHNRGATVWEFFLIVPVGVDTRHVYQVMCDRLKELKEDVYRIEAKCLMAPHSPVTPEVIRIMTTQTITSAGPAAKPSEAPKPGPVELRLEAASAQGRVSTAQELLQSIRRLEATANREQARKTKAQDLETERGLIASEILRLEETILAKRERLSQVELQELELLEESENDQEAKDATEVLHVLGRVLAGRV